MKTFLSSCLLSTCIGVSAVPAQLLDDIYGPAAMQRRFHLLASLESPSATDDTPADFPFIILAQVDEKPPSPRSPSTPRIEQMTPDELRATGRSYVSGINAQRDRLRNLLVQARNRTDPTAVAALTNHLNRLDVLRDDITRLNEQLKSQLGDNQPGAARHTLRLMDESANQATLVEQEANLIGNRQGGPSDSTSLSGETDTQLNSLDGFQGIQASGISGGTPGFASGVSGGGGGGGGGGSSSAGALAGLAGIAAAALAFSQDDDESQPLASPFTTDAFSQAPEAGGEAPASANPQMLGD